MPVPSPQLINIGSQYQYGNDDHAEFLCVVSRDWQHKHLTLNHDILTMIIFKQYFLKIEIIAVTFLKYVNLRNPPRLSHYIEYEKYFDLEEFSFPMEVKNVPKFEKRFNISISIYGYDEKEEAIYPIKVSQEKMGNHVDLLLVNNGETNHYCYIKDFGRLLNAQHSKHRAKTYFCRFCLHGFSRHTTTNKKQRYRTDDEMKKILQEHEEVCFALGAQCTKFPDDPVIRFKNIRRQLPAPFVVYADFESILQSMNEKNKIQEHQTCSYAYHIVSNIPGVEFEPRMYVGLDAAAHMLNSLNKDLYEHIKP